jgi:hypothetical protein
MSSLLQNKKGRRMEMMSVKEIEKEMEIARKMETLQVVGRWRW